MLFSAQLCSHASQVLIWHERWRFDQDGESTIEPEGADKQDPSGKHDFAIIGLGLQNIPTNSSQ